MSKSTAKDLRYKYDAESDVLYIALESGSSYVVEDEVCEGLHLRYRESDDKLIGAVILYYSVQDQEELKRRIPFEAQFPQL